MNDPRMAPKAVLPGEMFDADEMDRALAEDELQAECEQFMREVVEMEKMVENHPPAGSWASVARVMAEGDDSGFDWDAWKDECKERNAWD